MHQPTKSQSRARPSAEAPAVEFLAEVLIDRELPLDSAVDLTIIDLTDRAGIDTGGTDHAHAVGGGWGLFDETGAGRVVTPEHVLAARSAYRRIADGRPLVGSVGTVYPTAAGFADDYLSRSVLSDAKTVAADGNARDRAAIIRARHRLEYFLGLPDGDFLACFRFNGEITGEYLLQVGRCERQWAESVAERAESAPEPSPTQRRRRKSRSLRTI